MNMNETLNSLKKRFDSLESTVKALQEKRLILGEGKVVVHNSTMDIDKTVRISELLKRISDLESKYPNILNEAGVVKIGDIKKGNYTLFDTDGTMIAVGDATAWEDLNFDPVKSGGPASSRPDDVTINHIYYKEFTSANNQSCGDTKEIPHGSILSEIGKGHLHCFLKTGESAGTTGVTFTVYWELRDKSGLTSGSFTLSATSSQLIANPIRLDLYDNAGFSIGTGLGGQLGVALYRTGGNAGDVIVTTYGLHYKMDMFGSKEIGE